MHSPSPTLPRVFRWQRPALLSSLLCLVLVLTGCAQQYMVSTYTGGTFMTKGRPRLDHGYYVYKDATGKEQRINALRVRSIEVQ